MSQVASGHQIVRDVREALYLLQDEVEVAIDLETSGLVPSRDKVAVVSLYGDTTGALAILHVRGTVPPELKEFLEDKSRRFTYHNGVAFDIPFLLSAGVNAVKPPLFDTLVGAGILNIDDRANYSASLQAQVDKRLGVTLSKDSGGHGHWMDPVLTDQQIEYCADDIIHIHGLRRAQEAKAQELHMVAALKLETDIHAPTALMTHNGLPISLEALDGYLIEQHQVEAELTKQLTQRFGPINLGSHVQVKKMLRTLGLQLPTTNADFLEEVVYNGADALFEDREYRDAFGKPYAIPLKFYSAFEELGIPRGSLNADVMIELAREDRKKAEEAIAVLRMVVDARHALKRQNNYGPKFQETHVHNSTVHSRFKQAGTGTGRYSSSDPNLQQVPRDMRWVFGHKEGWSIVSVDYSQIEVVVAAYLSKDEALIKLIESGGDIHTLVAEQIFQLNPGSIDKKDPRRRIAKACSFTLLFGGGAQRLVDQARQEGAKITLREGEDIKDLFFRQFKGAARHRQEAIDLMRSGRRVVDIQLASGLKRRLIGPKIKSTTILNTQVQGTAAAGLKNGIRLAHQRGLSMYLGATVHDELTACVPAKWAEEYGAELSKAMIDGMARYVKIPARTEVKIGDTWS